MWYTVSNHDLLFQMRACFFCDADCCKADWPSHKFYCRLGRELDEADYLVLACQSKEYAEDETVINAYGFRCFISARDRQILFHLYSKLVDEGLEDEELRQARQKDKLKELLLYRCSQLPRNIIGTETDWLNRQEGLTADSICDISKTLHSGRQYLDPEEIDIPFWDLKPEGKRQAYLFYCQIPNYHMPDADEDNWISLGFCVAPDQEEFQRLATL
jgi:hypothetical protein